MELKDAAKKRKESLADFLKRDVEERLGKPVKTVWRVVEYIDSYDSDGNYIQNRARELDASEWFDTREEAEELMSKSKPSSNYYGAALRITSRTLYRKWIPAHWKETWV